MRHYPFSIRVLLGRWAVNVCLVVLSVAAQAEMPMIAPIFRSEPLPGVIEFAIAKSTVGQLTLIYCDADCSTIYYRHLNADGSWSPTETIKTGWDRKFNHGFGNFAADIDGAGNVHVFWGEERGLYANSVVQHAIRDQNGNWATTAAEPQGGGVGRINAVKIGPDDQLVFVTTTDYRVGGGYPFSNVEYFSGRVGETVQLVRAQTGGEEMYDLDIAIARDGLPVIALAQRMYGGWHRASLLYQIEGSWKKKTLFYEWAACVSPIQIVISNRIMVSTCRKVFALDTLEEEGAESSASGHMAMAVDDADEVYYSQSKYFSESTGWELFLSGVTPTGKIASIVVDNGEHGESGYRSRMLYQRNIITVTYLTKDGMLRVVGYDRDRVRSFLDRVFLLTIAKAGAGVGSVTSNPAGIDCGSTCTGEFEANTRVNLTAEAAPDSVFTGWSGACSGTGTCQVLMDQARSVTANFDSPSGDLSLELAAPKQKQEKRLVVYKLKIRNLRPERVEGTTVTAQWAGHPADSAVHVRLPDFCQSSGPKTICRLGELPGYGEKRLSLTLRPQTRGLLQFTATVDGKVTDVDPDNNTVVKRTRIVRRLAN